MTMTALILVAVLQPQATYELKWKPAKGDTLVYELFIKDKEMSVEASANTLSAVAVMAWL